jgi:phosphatidylinositol glycan class U
MLQVILLFGYGPDAPPRKLFWKRKNLEVDNSTTSDKSCLEDELVNEKNMWSVFSWRPVVLFLFWALLWSSYVLFLCGISVQQHGGLQEMFKRFCLNTMTMIHF